MLLKATPPLERQRCKRHVQPTSTKQKHGGGYQARLLNMPGSSVGPASELRISIERGKESTLTSPLFQACMDINAVQRTPVCPSACAYMRELGMGTKLEGSSEVLNKGSWRSDCAYRGCSLYGVGSLAVPRMMLLKRMALYQIGTTQGRLLAQDTQSRDRARYGFELVNSLSYLSYHAWHGCGTIPGKPEVLKAEAMNASAQACLMSSVTLWPLPSQPPGASRQTRASNPQK